MGVRHFLSPHLLKIPSSDSPQISPVARHRCPYKCPTFGAHIDNRFSARAKMWAERMPGNTIIAQSYSRSQMILLHKFVVFVTMLQNSEAHFANCKEKKSERYKWKSKLLPTRCSHCIMTIIRGAFNKFQDYIPYTKTINRTFLTVMLLFNILSLQFTAMFPLFYNSTETRSIKFFIGTCRNFRTCLLYTSPSPRD